MTRERDSGDSTLPLEALERIDRICREFESAWKRGERPRIEDCLGDPRSAERSQLFRELLVLDRDWRRRSGEEPTVEEYEQRFPEHLENIRRYLLIEPVLAGPPGLLYKLKKHAPKNQMPVVAVCAVFLALSIGLVVSIHFSIEASRSAQVQVAAEKAQLAASALAAEKDKKETLRGQELASENSRRALYIANLDQIERARERGDTSRIGDLLAQQIPGRDESDLRGFEWFYFSRLYGQNLELPLPGHLDWVTCIEFSPDGKFLASGSWDRTVKLWDAESGREVSTLRWTTKIQALSFSFDAELLAVAGFNGVRCWDLTTKEYRELALGVNRITLLAFSPQRNVLVAGGGDGIRLWDLDGDREKSNTTLSSDGDVLDITFSGDGERISALFGDGTVNTYDLDLRETSVTPGPGSRPQLWGTLFSDGKLSALGGCTESIVIRSPGETRRLAGHTDCVRALDFSADGRFLASGSDDTLVIIWDLISKTRLSPLSGHRDYVISVGFSPDGDLLASGGRDSVLRMWRVERRDGYTRLGVPRYSSTGAGAKIPSPTAFSADGKLLASFSDEGTVNLLNVGTGQTLDKIQLQLGRTIRGAIVPSLAFSPDSTILAVGQQDGALRLWHLARKDARSLLSGNDVVVRLLAFSGDGKLLASCSGSLIKLWDTRTGQERGTIESKTSVVKGLCCSANGRLLAHSGESALTVVDIRTRSKVFEVEMTDEASSLAFSPDGRLLASGLRSGLTQIWDLAGERAPLSLEGHTGPVHAVAFSPDGRDLATGGRDRSVRLWDLSLGHQRIAFREHRGEVTNIAFSADGNMMMTVDSHGHLIRREAADPEALENGSSPYEPACQAPRAESDVDPSRVVLEASPFRHLYKGVLHQSSRWQIRLASSDYNTPVLDSSSTTALTRLVVPEGLIFPGKKYYWRVAYRGSNGDTSGFSRQSAFIAKLGESKMAIVSVDLSQHFNVDIIANPGDKTEDSMDVLGSTLTMNGFDGIDPNNPAVRGLPAEGVLGVHRRGDYDGPNAIQITPGRNNVLIQLPPAAYHHVRFLVLATHGNPALAVNLHYRDGSSQVSVVPCDDWYDDNPLTGRGESFGELREGVVPVINRMDRLCKGLLDNANDPALFEFIVRSDPAGELSALELDCRNSTFGGQSRIYVFAIAGARRN